MSTVWTFRVLYTLHHEYWAMQACFAAATGVVEYLSPGTVQVDTFIKACQALSEMGTYLPLAESFLASVKSLLTRSNITLPRYGERYLVDRRTRQGDVYTSSIRVSTQLLSADSDRQEAIDVLFAELLLDGKEPIIEID
ncbi:hypothetical protein IL306_008830 [Fusarium sp. DS 682]|nr:hypothetical protein IL306_008830 [Fusarium sp. DS 682]